MDVHLRDLRYFVAVAEERHFTRAAGRLFVSQPVLSRQVAKLERDLRVILLERDPRKVALTAAGEVLLERARTLLADWDDARRATSDAAAAAAAVLRLGMQTSVGRGVLPLLHARLAESHPGWRLDPVTVDWNDPSCGLADGSVDVAVTWLPLPDEHAYRWVLIASEPRQVALPRGHPLAGRQAVTFAEIADEAFIALPSEAGPLRDFWLAVDDRDGRPPTVAATAHSAEQACEMAAAGLGVTLIAAGNAELYQRPDLVYVPVSDLEPARLVLAWRADDGRQVVRALTDEGDRAGASPDAPPGDPR